MKYNVDNYKEFDLKKNSEWYMLIYQNSLVIASCLCKEISYIEKFDTVDNRTLMIRINNCKVRILCDSFEV